MLNKRILVLIFVVAFLLLIGCYAINQAPIITSDPNTTATVGEAYTYNVEATDPDVGDTLTYTLAVKPFGMTIHSLFGLINWDPQIKDVGDNEITVVVSDGDLDITQSFIITVVEEEEPVKLIGIKVSPDKITMSVGDTKQLEVTALYDDGNHGDITSDCIYTSSNTKVVPLFDDGNLIAGQSPGKATITVTYISDDETVFTDTAEVTVGEDISEQPNT